MKKDLGDLAKSLAVSKNKLKNWTEIYCDFLELEVVDGQVQCSKESLKYFRIIKKGEAAGKNQVVIEQSIIQAKVKEEYIKYKERHNIEKEKIVSPLRFPGSKSKVLGRFVPYFDEKHIEYREPFFGGGSIFLGKHKSKINLLNDMDENVYSFFVCVRDYANELCSMIRDTNPTLELWLEKRSKQEHGTIIEKGFDFLFFNRTNYSGIYNANPIGGMKQISEYKIDCRWNQEKLCKNILNSSLKLQNVEISNVGFEEIIQRPGKNVLMVVDPPYYHQGDKLYPVSMSRQDHIRLAQLLRETKHKYLLTIDDCPETREIYLYEGCYINQESWHYTVNSSQSGKLGKELFISNFKV